MRHTGIQYLMKYLGIFILCVFPVYVSAIEYGGFGARPAYPRLDNPRTESIFVHTVDSGEIVSEGVQVINNTNTTKRFRVYAADSVASTDGGFACRQLSEEKEGVGAWIQLESTEVQLAPNTNEVVPFTITVPKNASVGEHNGCILIQEIKDTTSSGAGIVLSVRTGLRVALTIPGELVWGLRIDGVDKDRRDNGAWVITPIVTNTGNVSLDTDVVVQARSFVGSDLTKYTGTFPILRNDTARWNFDIGRPFWGGWYGVDVKIGYEKGSNPGVETENEERLELISPRLWFFAFPQPIALLIEFGIVAILIGGFAYFIRRRRYGHWVHTEWVDYMVQTGETLEELSRRHSMSWKVLARVNKLHAPYNITGKKLRVPPSVHKK